MHQPAFAHSCINDMDGRTTQCIFCFGASLAVVAELVLGVAYLDFWRNRIGVACCIGLRPLVQRACILPAGLSRYLHERECQILRQTLAIVSSPGVLLFARLNTVWRVVGQGEGEGASLALN